MAVDVISSPPIRQKRHGVPAGLSTCLRYGAVLLSVGVALVSYRYVARLGPIPPNVTQKPVSSAVDHPARRRCRDGASVRRNPGSQPAMAPPAPGSSLAGAGLCGWLPGGGRVRTRPGRRGFNRSRGAGGLYCTRCSVDRRDRPGLAQCPGQAVGRAPAVDDPLVRLDLRGSDAASLHPHRLRAQSRLQRLLSGDRLAGLGAERDFGGILPWAAFCISCAKVKKGLLF